MLLNTPQTSRIRRRQGLLGNNPEKNAKYVIRAIDHFIGNDPKRAITREWIRNWLREGGPGREWLGRILKNVHSNVRRRYIARMFVSLFFRDHEINERVQQRYGINSPHVMIISPTMLLPNFSGGSVTPRGFLLIFTALLKPRSHLPIAPRASSNFPPILGLFLMVPS